MTLAVAAIAFVAGFLLGAVRVDMFWMKQIKSGTTCVGAKVYRCTVVDWAQL